jgi:hypothetical protein
MVFVNTFFAAFEVCEGLEAQCDLGDLWNRCDVEGIRCTV